MSAVVSSSLESGIAVVTIDSPPVNALGVQVRQGLTDCFSMLDQDPAVRAIVLICAGRTFVAGADIAEFGKPPQAPSLQTIFELIERSTRPVVAAIHGTALGGGLELALVCHYRIAVSTAKLGLPEVTLGLLPGAGGTQRLPRLVGIEKALDMIAFGKPIGAHEALALGLIDALAETPDLRASALHFAQQLLVGGKPLKRARDRDDMVAPYRNKPEIFAAFRKANARSFRGFRAPESIITALEAAVALPFEQGLERENSLFLDLLASPESAAQRYAFFAERDSAKVPDIGADVKPLDIATVGVIGAGTMGGGIAMNFLNAGIPVTLVEVKQEALDRGLGVIRANYETSAKKGRLSLADVENRMRLLTPSLDLKSLAQADLIIEAVFESLDMKQQIFRQLDQIAKPGAVLATNTSYLNVNVIAAATRRPEQVLGLHFFSPANVMRLLEIVRGAKTSTTLIATALRIAKKIGKVPVVSGVCHGFIANRVMTTRTVQADAMALEGTDFSAIDAALFDYGFAMGPFAMMDLVGLDVIGRDSTERTVRGDLVSQNRLGQKKNGGFYDYDAARKATPAPIAYEIIKAVAVARGVKLSPTVGNQEIIARTLYVVVNEGAKLLQEGIALRASDIDIACMQGYNWPVYTGGPMFWANNVGLPKIVAKLNELQARYGDEFKPAALLSQLAAAGKLFS